MRKRHQHAESVDAGSADPLGTPPASHRRDPIERMVSAWRELSRGGRTVVAVSGGADSSALLLALARATGDIRAAHVIHDLRPRDEALADAETSRRLADTLGVLYVEVEINVREAAEHLPSRHRNLEGVARRLRYRTLADVARGCGAECIATGHHADDQLETVLGAIARGTGPRGLRGMARERLLQNSPPVRLIRPMLTVTHADALEVCRNAGWAWSEDQTNRADSGGTRARLRHEVLPALRDIFPEVAHKAVSASGHARAMCQVVDSAAHSLDRSARLPDTGILGFDRRKLRHAPAILIGEVLRRAGGRMLDGVGLDSLGRSRLWPIIRAIRDSSGERREFQGPRGLRMVVHADRVEIRRIASE